MNEEEICGLAVDRWAGLRFLRAVDKARRCLACPAAYFTSDRVRGRTSHTGKPLQRVIGGRDRMSVLPDIVAGWGAYGWP